MAEQSYSVEEVSELVGMSASEVRRCIREGILTSPPAPGERARLSFQDLVVLRKAASIARKVPRARVRRALSRLKEQVPDVHLASVAVQSEGRALCARVGGALWDPLSRQMRFDLHGGTGAAAQVLEAPAVARRKEEAERLYDAAYELELEDETAARVLYARALERDPSHVESHINLGRLLHAAGELAQAEAAYRRAISHAPDSALAAFNLGVLLEDLGRTDEALAAYESALGADASLADAHFNAARLHERQGYAQEALRHWNSYRRLARDPLPGRSA